MQAMIGNKQQPLKKDDAIQMTDFVKLKKVETETQSQRELELDAPPPPPPPPPEQEPIEEKPLPEMEIPQIDMPQPDVLNSQDVQLAVVKKPKPKPKIEKPKTVVKTTAKPTTTSTVTAPVTTPTPTKKVVKKEVKPAPPKMSNTVNANVRPTYTVPPKYPKRAQQRRQEGWVKVQFIITANGSVKSPFVVASKPSGVFDKEALKAIRRWKFKPKVVNGQKVAQRAVQTVRFKLR